MSALDREILALMRRVTEEVILPHYRSLDASQIEDKADDDLVTVADRESEDLIAEALARLEPGVPIVGEEAAHADPSVLDALGGPCWIVDPIDGTNNFARGKPPFGVLVARCAGGLAQSGWIFDCLSGRFCAAHRGGGAFVDGERITARSTGEDPPVAAISKLFITPDVAAWVEENIEPHFRLVEIPRCAAEQYPRLAFGENDVSSFNRTLPWDHAVGALWLNEAGGFVARYDGGEYRVDEPERRGMLAASTPGMWDRYIAIIRPLVDRDR